MWFWWFILVCDLLVPFTMLIAGRMMWKHCPKHINGVVGYRTRRSMKNIETWKFAHDYCGQLWWKIGLWMIIPSVLVHVPFYHSDEDAIGNVSLILVIIQCIVLVLSILPTEHALKKKFYDDGTLQIEYDAGRNSPGGNIIIITKVVEILNFKCQEEIFDELYYYRYRL